MRRTILFCGVCFLTVFTIDELPAPCFILHEIQESFFEANILENVVQNLHKRCSLMIFEFLVEGSSAVYSHKEFYVL